MDRFEELGLNRSATNAEISRAHKRLAGLLHPDRQRDPELRALAELQMRRLNETVAMLLDPKQRRRYESEIDSTSLLQKPRIIVVPTAPADPKRPGVVSVQSMWCFVGGILLATAFWYPLTTSGPLSKATVIAAPTTEAGSADSLIGAEFLERIRDLETQVAALRQGRKSNAPAAAHDRSLAGSWIYQADSADPHLRSVTLQLSEADGLVRGNYTSTTGRSGATLAFRFEGKGTQSYVRAPWSGADGANGEIEVRLLRPNLLEARWWAYRATREMPETSSAAILRRL